VNYFAWIDTVYSRPFSEICRELAHAAEAKDQPLLAKLLRMASLEAAESGATHDIDDVSTLLVGSWDWDVVNNRLYADAQMARFYGVDAEQAAEGVPQSQWADAVHPEDRGAVDAAVARALWGEPFCIDYRIVTNGTTRWVHARGRCTFGNNGQVTRFAGAVIDITHEKLDDPALSIAPG
jgi:PAS domain S-box-containing protein